MTTTNDDHWHDSWLAAVHELSVRIKSLNHENPWPENPLLPQAMNYLMTELWDQGFSQTEIRKAFEDAIADMSRYAAGEERRP